MDFSVVIDVRRFVLSQSFPYEVFGPSGSFEPPMLLDKASYVPAPALESAAAARTFCIRPHAGRSPCAIAASHAIPRA